MESYDKKIIISGKFVEYCSYIDYPIIRGEKRERRIKANYEFLTIDKEEQKQRANSSVNRTRTEIQRLINCNPQLIKFLTLTFKENIIDIEKANYFFNIFIQKMKSQFPEFQYLAVVEFQERGAVHYHLLCNLRYVKSQDIEKIWKHGFIRINRIDRVKNLGTYICKYLRKEMFDKRMFRKKKYFRSQDLKKPVEFIGDEAVYFMEEKKNDLKFIREYQITSEYHGRILYQFYQFKN